MTRGSLAGALIVAIGAVALARDLLTAEEALALAFGKDAMVRKRTVELTEAELAAARKLAGGDVVIEGKPVVAYEASENGKLLGTAYLDAFVVRTLPARVLVVIEDRASDPRQAAIARIEVLSWDEPPDYLPKAAWLEQVKGRKLDDDLSLPRSVRPMTGATITSQALVRAGRRALAIHIATAASPASAPGPAGASR